VLGRVLCIRLVAYPEECGVSKCDHEASINEEALPHKGLLCHGEERVIT
jgi:hypothetical protein